MEDEGKHMLKVVIEDNGIGRKQSSIINEKRETSHLSLGMKITNERLNLLDDRNASILTEDLINIDGDAMGTRIVLMIPIENS